MSLTLNSETLKKALIQMRKQLEDLENTEANFRAKKDLERWCGNVQKAIEVLNEKNGVRNPAKFDLHKQYRALEFISHNYHKDVFGKELEKAKEKWQKYPSN